MTMLTARIVSMMMIMRMVMTMIHDVGCLVQQQQQQRNTRLRYLYDCMDRTKCLL
jgi:hypothetical protein